MTTTTTADGQDGNQKYGLVLSFGGLFQNMAEEQAFVLGVEFGQLWTRMTAGAEAEIEGTYQVMNRTVIERAAAGQGWDCEIKTIVGFDTWLQIKLTKVAAAKPNPHGLRIVK